MNAGRVILIHAFSEDPEVITAALRVARNAAQSLPDAIVEVVVQGIAVTGLTVGGRFEDDIAQRSEEHTSELQSLMRISYAVFCLKKKKEYSIATSVCIATTST